MSGHCILPIALPITLVAEKWKGKGGGVGGRALRFRLGLQIWRREYLKDFSAHAREEQVPDGGNITAFATRGRTNVVQPFVSFVPAGRVRQLRDKMRQQVAGVFPADGGHSRDERR